MPSFHVFLAIVSLVVCLPSIRCEAAWKAGAAKKSITPPEYIWMSGYGSRDKPAEGKLTDLWAKALVLEDSKGERVVLITLDLVGIDDSFAAKVCAKIKPLAKVSRKQISLCCSHTHTGPVAGRNLAPMHYLQLAPEQQKKVDEYENYLTQQVVNAVEEAVSKLEVSLVKWGVGNCNFAVNRRNNPEVEVPNLRTAGELKGPVDHDVPVLAVFDEKENLKTIVFGYACHATVLSFYQWSGDYPGFAQIELESRFPSAIAMFWAGCGADQNPLPRRTVELAEHYGKRLANSVESVLRTSTLKTLPDQIESELDYVSLTYDEIPSEARLTEMAASSDRFERTRAKFLLEQLESEGKIAETYPYPVQLWKLGGEIDWVFLGGEVVVDYAIRLKSNRSPTKTWVAGYANDVMAYIPSKRVWLEGGYEGGGSMVYYGLPSRWSEDVEDRIFAKLDQLVPAPQ